MEGEQKKKNRPLMYVGNSQFMLREIRESLQHLKRQSDRQESSGSQLRSGSNTTLTGNVGEQSSQHNPNRRFSGHAKTLAEIRNSLEPYATTTPSMNEFTSAVDPYSTQLPESGYSSSSECSTFSSSGESANRQYLNQLKPMGLDEVRELEHYDQLSPYFFTKRNIFSPLCFNAISFSQ